MGAGYDNALEYINHLIGIETIEFPSGTELGTWTVPQEWIPKDAWVKHEGVKIIDYKENPIALMVGAEKIHCTLNDAEMRQHLIYSDEKPNATPYSYTFYDKKWAFNVPKTFVREAINEIDESVPVSPDGAYTLKTKSCLPEGEYEVFIDTETRPGKMKLGVHTIPGKSDREILLFAHLDHPFQANDNLSGVVCLIDLAKKLKCEHTVKIIFCPETIGSIAYALTQDISRVDFVISVDICGNDNSLLMQKTFEDTKFNRVAHLALNTMGESFRKGMFRNTIGSDEYAFNDPQIGIPAIMLSRHPYPEYHTSEDTPDRINYDMIEKTGDVIQKIIAIYEADFVPVRKFKGPLMRSRYGIQGSAQENLAWDYLIYSMDGKKSLAELCCDIGLNWDYVLEAVNKIIDDGKILRSDVGEKPKQKTTRKKHASV